MKREERSKTEFFNIKEEMMFNITEKVLSGKLIQNASAAREREKYPIRKINPFLLFPKTQKLEILRGYKAQAVNINFRNFSI